jgi:TRAP-type C4-dicarboxylate transport system permease small subunit
VDRPIITFLALVAGIVAAAFVRAYLDRAGRLRGLFKFLGAVEIGLIALLLTALIFFGCLQIVLRNFFHRGLVWADPLMRHLVLWLGCLGGVYATSKMRHISIDFLTRFLPKKAKLVRDRIVYLATSVATALLGFAALRLVLEEKAFGEKEFLDIPIWMLQAILPATFLLISYRCLLNSIRPPEVKPIDWEGQVSREDT